MAMSSPKKVSLNNQNITVSVLPERGALISSIVTSGTEILFKDAAFDSKASSWPSGGIPVLFPFAGRVFNGPVQGEYLIEGKIHRMPIHGFAYGVEWKTLKEEADKVVLELRASEASKALYPWEFTLIYTIKVNESSVHTELEVTSNGYCGEIETKELLMPVSPGFHPYFMVLEQQMHVTPNELITKYDVTGTGAIGKDREVEAEEVFKTSDKELKSSILSHARSFKHKVKTGNLEYSLSSPEAKYTVLWTDSDQEFQCVEPWAGIPDSIGFTALGTDKEAVHPFSCQLLKKGESFTLNLELKL